MSFMTMWEFESDFTKAQYDIQLGTPLSHKGIHKLLYLFIYPMLWLHWKKIEQIYDFHYEFPQ